MLHNPFTEISAKIDRTLKALIFASAAGAAGFTAVFLFSLGGFVWLRDNYGTADACVVLGAVYAVVAIAALTTLLILQRKQAVRAAAQPKAVAPWWQDPTMLAVGVEILRVVPKRRWLPLALAAALAGAVLGGLTSSPAPRPQARPRPNGKGTFTEAAH